MKTEKITFGFYQVFRQVSDSEKYPKRKRKLFQSIPRKKKEERRKKEVYIFKKNKNKKTAQKNP